MKIEQHVFVVDEVPSARIGLTRLLIAAGFRVHSFISFNDFLKSIKPEEHGGILLDPCIPGFETTELKEKLSKSGQKLKVFFITDADNEETRMKAKELNAAGFFRKPVDGPALLDAIKWALRNDKLVDNGSN